MKKRRTKSISYILIAMLLLCVGVFSSGCRKKASDFTEEEHIQRISERIETRDSTWGYPDGESYQSFEVYPLYDQNDELKYFLVEFEPYGFIFVIADDDPLFLSCFGYSMYSLSNCYGKNYTWSPYIIDETNSQPYPDRDKIWIPDENGEQIFYEKSPYSVTSNIKERKYLLETDSHSQFICAIKKDGEFINLISEKTINISHEAYPHKSHETLYIYFINKPMFSL